MSIENNKLPENPNINVEGLKPFKKLCMTIGTIPASYMEAMSYQELLLWLCDFLKNSVIPTVNNNAEAVQELQDLYVELKSYVDNYFTNLDVQEEINNKLDKMASDGTLENIINQEIFGDINNKLDLLLDKKYIFIGDSYNTTDTPSGGVPIVPWSSRLVNYLGLSADDYYNSGVSGAGFVNGTTFLQQLQNLAPSITNKDKITDIVVMGGINDMNADLTSLYNALIQFATYCKTTFPNAIVTLGMISWARSDEVRNKLISIMSYYNNIANQPNVRIISDAFTWFHNYSFYQPDGHPNLAGSISIAYNLANTLKNGVTNMQFTESGQISPTNSFLNVENNIGSFSNILNGLNTSILLKLNTINNLTIENINLGDTHQIGEINSNLIMITDMPLTNGIGWVYDGSSYTPFNYTLIIRNRNQLFIRFDGYNNNGNIVVNNPKTISFGLVPIVTIPTMSC